MPEAIQQLYAQTISTLSPTEQFQLATLILNELVQQNTVAVDESDIWTDQDQLDMAAYSLQYAVTAFSNSEEMTE